MHDTISRPLSADLAAYAAPIDYRAVYVREARSALFRARHHRIAGEPGAAARCFAYAVRFTRLLREAR